ncbi:MAG: hypothetical protein Q4F88_01295 [Eubacteriales bacterium]|nr:hypothetical protein [Eubacteriales bacterium]
MFNDNRGKYELFDIVHGSYDYGWDFVFILFFGIFCTIIALIIVTYLFNTYSYKKIFKTYNYEHLGCAWVPILRLHILGCLSFDDSVSIFSLSLNKKYLVWWWVFLIFAILIYPAFGLLIAVFLIPTILGKIYNIVFKKLDPSYNEIVLGIVCVFIPIIMWVKVLSSK